MMARLHLGCTRQVGFVPLKRDDFTLEHLPYNRHCPHSLHKRVTQTVGADAYDVLRTPRVAAPTAGANPLCLLWTYFEKNLGC